MLSWKCCLIFFSMSEDQKMQNAMRKACKEVKMFKTILKTIACMPNCDKIAVVLVILHALWSFSYIYIFVRNFLILHELRSCSC